MNVNLPVLSSKPKKPTLAAEPVWYLNSIPLSLLSSDDGAVSPPSVNTGSSTVTVVLFTVVVVPLTVRLPNVTLADVPTSCPIDIAPLLYVTPVPPDRWEFTLASV